jgi:polyhydroxyalkanoate synthesis regulator phasin
MTAEYVNIMEAARRCGGSDKTIRRWIHAQKVPARFPQSNRCEIAISDLELFLPGQSTQPLESRVTDLERQVQALQRYGKQR